MGTLNSSLVVCEFDSDGHLLNGTDGCYFLTPVFEWISRCIISIFLVFMIAFLPLFLQGKPKPCRLAIFWLNALPELTERGAGKALLRLGRQFLSVSPAFEVFATRISSHSITSNLIFGGARYIATGRGFATTRISFCILFSRFAGPSIYLGMRNLIMLLYVTITLWTGWILYFWGSILALCLAPFLFNPHQFAFADFFIDYR